MLNNILTRIISKCAFVSFLMFLSLSAKPQSEMGNLTVEISRMNYSAKAITPPSPEAAELGKYGNTPVSLFTGTPKINIPLYDISGNSLSLPVNISYNASGYKPETIATWIGLNWSLNAGGVITRSALGNPDVENNYFTPVSPFTVPPILMYLLTMITRKRSGKLPGKCVRMCIFLISGDTPVNSTLLRQEKSLRKKKITCESRIALPVRQAISL